MTVCPHCGGTGFARDADVELEVEALAISLRASCVAADRTVFGDDRVDEKTAAWLIGRRPGTLRNWRGAHRPIPFAQPGGRVSYRLADLARWMLENGSEREI